MYKIKLVNLAESKRTSLLFDNATSLPCLYPLIYVRSMLKFKSESTQQSHLQAIKQWYEFWQKKHLESFCKYFHSHKENPKLMIQEIDNFLIYLENSGILDDKLLRLGTRHSISYSTVSNRFRFILSFFEYLLDSFTHIHGTSVKSQVSNYKSILSQKRQIVKNISTSSYKESVNFKSLTLEMKIALEDMISPISPTPLFKNKKAQFRNYLMVHLLINYGLRTGELLLLSTDSLKPDLKNKSYKLLVIDTEDQFDVRKEKPHIKNQQSIRIIELNEKDYKLLYFYIEKIRSKHDSTKILFTSLQAPYSPISKSAFKKMISKIDKQMQKLYPHFFDSAYIDSIDNISAHTLRHTWAYLYLKHSFEFYKKNNSNNDMAMEQAISDLRKMGGWSLKSTMPYLYANRFRSEHANLQNTKRIEIEGTFYEK